MTELGKVDEQEYQWLMKRKVLYLEKAGVTDIELTGKNIRPSNLSKLPFEKQQGLIDLIRGNYGQSFAFFGEPQTGKTTMANLLFKEAVLRLVNFELEMKGVCFPAHVWRITARALCQQAQDIAMRVDPEEGCFTPGEMMEKSRRIVNRERIMRAHMAGFRPRLFIEEWDKVGLTDFRRETLFDVLDAIVGVKGQLVITSNLTWDDFVATFGETCWRIDQNCFVVQLSANKVAVAPPKRKPIAPFVP